MTPKNETTAAGLGELGYALIAASTLLRERAKQYDIDGYDQSAAQDRNSARLIRQHIDALLSPPPLQQAQCETCGGNGWVATTSPDWPVKKCPDCRPSASPAHEPQSAGDGERAPAKVIDELRRLLNYGSSDWKPIVSEAIRTIARLSRTSRPRRRT